MSLIQLHIATYSHLQATAAIFGTALDRNEKITNPEKSQKGFGNVWGPPTKQNSDSTGDISTESFGNPFNANSQVKPFSFDAAKSAPPLFTFNSAPLPSGLFQHLNSTSNGQIRSNRLSSSVLRITRCGPDETNFAIVDVPGLVRGKQYFKLR